MCAFPSRLLGITASHLPAGAVCSHPRDHGALQMGTGRGPSSPLGTKRPQPWGLRPLSFGGQDGTAALRGSPGEKGGRCHLEAGPGIVSPKRAAAAAAAAACGSAARRCVPGLPVAWPTDVCPDCVYARTSASSKPSAFILGDNSVP